MGINKECLTCGKTKPASEFHKDSSKRDNLRPYCKSCRLHAEAERRNIQHPLYNTWQAMKKRCYYPKHDSYPSYGGRGVVVCDRWKNSFENFLEDVGEKPGPEYTLDRINNEGDYTPENVRWATKKQQARNTRWNKLNEDIAFIIRDTPDISNRLWSKMLGCSISTIKAVRENRTWKNEIS